MRILKEKNSIPKEYRVDGMPKEIDELWEKGIKIIKENGGQIIEISLPNTIMLYQHITL